jgi:hypothetical protein
MGIFKAGRLEIEGEGKVKITAEDVEIKDKPKKDKKRITYYGEGSDFNSGPGFFGGDY